MKKIVFLNADKVHNYYVHYFIDSEGNRYNVDYINSFNVREYDFGRWQYLCLIDLHIYNKQNIKGISELIKFDSAYFSNYVLVNWDLLNVKEQAAVIRFCKNIEQDFIKMNLDLESVFSKVNKYLNEFDFRKYVADAELKISKIARGGDSAYFKADIYSDSTDLYVRRFFVDRYLKSITVRHGYLTYYDDMSGDGYASQREFEREVEPEWLKFIKNNTVEMKSGLEKRYSKRMHFNYLYDCFFAEHEKQLKQLFHQCTTNAKKYIAEFFTSKSAEKNAALF